MQLHQLILRMMALLLLLLLLSGSCSAFLPLAAVRRVPLLNQHDRLLSLKTRINASSGLLNGGSATTLGLLPDTVATTIVTTTTTIETVPQDMVTTEGAAAVEVVIAGLDPLTTVLIFLVGLVPFAVATVEFWRRIRFGQAFGTGSDSVVFTNDVSIGEDNAPLSSRGTRVLGQGALITAVILFAVAAAVIGLAVVSVVTSGIPTSF